ncbi:S-adenosyl-L-methionine-dependent methyltransferase [Teratosphaeria destructans]|uniref:S-adenosyl-L-methionine-dependent methyltransferase n=1 Tax=Teratosphaeria destructans TaxID=418781 RepID=A0A9W7W627_9PEZI|nr:S-adenosyl-L-methionine-dependent methyltransferase [Teratosphaeria destructans]
MNDDQAYRVASNFGSLISAYSNASAQAYLTTNYTDYTDSVIELINSGCNGPEVLGEATFAGLEAFEAGQGSQPNITFELLNVWYDVVNPASTSSWLIDMIRHNCETVTLRWEGPMPNPDPSTAPPVQEAVRGIIVLETTFEGWDATEPFKINTSYSEFNSGAWLVDLGVFVPQNCSSPVKRDQVKRALPVMMRRH